MMTGTFGVGTAMVWKLLERGGSQVVTLLVQIVLARLLLPEDFGTLAVILVFINVGNVLVQSGLNMALVQAKDVKDSDYFGVFAVSFCIVCVLFSALWLCAPLIAGFYELPNVSKYLRVLGILLIVNAFNCVQIAYMARNMLFSGLCKCTLIASIVSGALGVLFAWLGAGLWALVAQQVSNQLVLGVLLSIVIPWKPQFKFEPNRVRSLFSFGWKVCVSNCVNALYQNAYDLVVGKSFSAGMLGYFSQGRKYPNALEAVFDEAIQAVMLPSLSRKQDDRESLKRSLRVSLSVELCFIAPIMVLVALFAEEIVCFVLTDKWLPCAPFVRLFCIGYLFAPLSSNNLQALYALGRSDIVLGLEFIKKAIGLLILFVTAIVIHELMLVAIGAVVYNVIVVTINGFPNTRLLGYRAFEQIVDYGAPLLSVAVASALAQLIRLIVAQGYIGLIAEGLAFLFTYVLMISVLKPIGWTYCLQKIQATKNQATNIAKRENK